MQVIKWLIVCLVCFAFYNGSSTLVAAAHSSIKKHEISQIPATGLLIDSPGTYVFKNDIVWTPSGGGAAIYITSKDVTLDLQNHSLKSSPNSYITIGILAAAAKNLTIKNGTIANMALNGIQCDICENVVIKDITVDGLRLNETAIYTVPTGILVSGSKNVCINKCKVKNIDVTTGSTAAIQLTATLSSKVINCRVSNLINRDGACTGIGHLLCDTAEVKSCVLDRIESQFINNLNTEGHTAIGIIPVGSKNLKIENCKISNITGCCDDAHGMSLFECQNAVVKKCRVENVLDGAGTAQTGAKATGIEIYGSQIKVINCFVKNITAINPQDKQATGFSCAQASKVKFIGCRAEKVNVVDQNGAQSSSLGYGTGFGWAPDPRNEFISPAVKIYYKNCTAKWCQVGFDSWFHIDSLWENIHSICNGIAVLNLNHSQRTLSCNPCSECGCLALGCYPNPLTVAINNVAKNNTFTHVRAKYCNKQAVVFNINPVQ